MDSFILSIPAQNLTTKHRDYKDRYPKKLGVALSRFKLIGNAHFCYIPT